MRHAFVFGNCSKQSSSMAVRLVHAYRAARSSVLCSYADTAIEKQLGEFMDHSYVFAGDAPYGEGPGLECDAARLVSYAQSNVDRAVEPFDQQGSLLYLDSGAYSAYTRGIKIDLHAYIEFLKEYDEIVDFAFNLDAIPGKKGGEASASDIEDGVQFGFDNWRTMREAGLHSIHVFHHREPDWVLERLRDEALAEMPYPYIAIGGAATLTHTTRNRWLANSVWPKLVDKDGVPLLAVHGLGITDIKTVTMFPWRSIDSTSWIFSTSQGKIALWRDGVLKWYYASERHRQGWQNYNQMEKDAIAAALALPQEAFCNLPPKEQFLVLMQHNLRTIKQVEDRIPDKLTARGRRQRKVL